MSHWFAVALISAIVITPLLIFLTLFGAIGIFMIAIIGLAIAAVFAIMIIQRLHDNNQSAWLVLLLFIPVMNALLLLYLACAPGTPGSNRYGLKPPPNSTLNWVGGIIQLLIMTLFSGVSLLMALISS